MTDRNVRVTLSLDTAEYTARIAEARRETLAAAARATRASLWRIVGLAGTTGLGVGVLLGITPFLIWN